MKKLLTFVAIFVSWSFLVLSVPALAHVPFLERYDYSEDRPFFVRDIEKSIAAYSWFQTENGASNDVDLYLFYIPSPTRVFIESLVPVCNGYEDRLEHVDSGDLFLTQRYEVKRLTRHFTGREDWPFGEKFIVCAKHAFDNAEQKPHLIVILNPSMTVAAIVKGSDCDKWYWEWRRDSRYQDMLQKFYFSPIEDVIWRAL